MQKQISIKKLFISALCIFTLILNNNISFAACKTAQDNKIRIENWIEDINTLFNELENKSPLLFSNLSKKDFENNINTLKNNVPVLTNDEIKLKLRQIVASLKDSHTEIYYPSKFRYPIILKCFDDDFYVIQTTPKYKNIIYKKLVKINNKPIKDVINCVKSIISYENNHKLKLRLQDKLMNADFLYTLKIIDNKNKAILSFQDKNAKITDVEVSSINMKKEEIIKMKNSFIVKPISYYYLPLYMQNNSNYWFKYLKDSKSIYFQYNQCSNMKEKSCKEFSKELFDFIDNHPVDKFIIDLRNNSGGSDGVFYPILKEIKERNNINKKGKLFVIVGKKTFSSAIINTMQLKYETNAIFVGEPTGGKPNHYGFIREFKLKNSGLLVIYSTKYIDISKYYNDTSSYLKTALSFIPDINVTLTLDDYLNLKDPVLDKILSIKKAENY